MQRQFLVKKDPNAERANTEWVSMTVDEFNAFRASPEGKERYFVELEDLTIEASKEQYAAWRKERDHELYILQEKRKSGITVISLEALYHGEVLEAADNLMDQSVDVEEEALRRIDIERLYECLRMLDEESLQIITALFFSQERKSQRMQASEMGLSQMAISKRTKKILEKLKFLVLKSKKSPQRKV